MSTLSDNQKSAVRWLALKPGLRIDRSVVIEETRMSPAEFDHLAEYNDRLIHDNGRVLQFFDHRLAFVFREVFRFPPVVDPNSPIIFRGVECRTIH